ncbi:phosphate ABC transporter permease PstA [bacterium]|nr:phosphate ABC transporter permease PstA [bacterium]
MVDSKKLKSIRSPGEPLVWFTGLGLVVGIVMVTLLLALVFVKGMQSFWPRDVVVATLKEGSSFRSGNIIGGEITRDREKRIQTEGVEKPEKEIQFYTGNKDTYGESFVYIDQNDIVKKEKPAGIIKIERLEYGNALGYPQKINLINGDEILVSAQNFEDKLSDLTDEVNDRWDEIRDIEKIKIGAINTELEKIRSKKKVVEEKAASNPEVLFKIKDFEKNELELNADYKKLADKARELRAKQNENKLTIKLVSGESVSLNMGQVLHYYYPNQLGIFSKGILFVQNGWHFLTEDPREANTEGGIFPALFGTFVMTLLMCIFTTPFGVMAAIYLKEYAKQGFFLRLVRIAVNNLAGVPSIVFGVFGLGFFVYTVGSSIDELFFWEKLPTPTFGTGGMLWSSLTLALLTLPVVIVATEEALSGVGQPLREASFGCGASKWQTIARVILPASAPGILTGMILAMARGAGEVAPLMLVGVVKLAPTLPINGIFPYFHFDQKFMHLGFHIYDLGFQSPDSEAVQPMVFATTLFLIATVVCLNIGAIYIREKLRRKYASSAF